MNQGFLESKSHLSCSELDMGNISYIKHHCDSNTLDSTLIDLRKTCKEVKSCLDVGHNKAEDKDWLSQLL